MASPQEVEAAVLRIAALLAAVDPELRTRWTADRTVSCRVPDLGVVWSGRLCDDGIVDVSAQETERSQVRLSVRSDDLVALSEGRLSVPAAWATGRLTVQASPMDLLRLRALLPWAPPVRRPWPS